MKMRGSRKGGEKEEVAEQRPPPHGGKKVYRGFLLRWRVG